MCHAALRGRGPARIRLEGQLEWAAREGRGGGVRTDPNSGARRSSRVKFQKGACVCVCVCNASRVLCVWHVFGSALAETALKH